MIYGAKIMWIKTLTQSVGLTCLMGLSSCDKVQGLVGDITGSGDPQERREGISKLHEASASDVREWLAEPNVLVVLDFYSDSCPPCIAMMPALHKMAERKPDPADGSASVYLPSIFRDRTHSKRFPDKTTRNSCLCTFRIWKKQVGQRACQCLYLCIETRGLD